MFEALTRHNSYAILIIVNTETKMEETPTIETKDVSPVEPNGIGRKVLNALVSFVKTPEEAPDPHYEARRTQILSRAHPLFPSRNELASIDTSTFGPEQYIASKELEMLFSQVTGAGEDESWVETAGLTTEQVMAFSDLQGAASETARRTARILLLQVGSHERDLYANDEKAQDNQLKSFEKQLTYYLCRAIVTMTERGSNPVETLVNNRDDLISLLGEVPQLVEDVYKTDIPLYDKVLEEFDEMRNENPDMLEVYLSRDGVFAYIARRAQAAARGIAVRNDSEIPDRDGEEQTIVPKYKNMLINRAMIGRHDDYDIPQDFADYTEEQQEMIKTTVRTYVKQSGLVDEDVHFFDTGYVGSIPAEILSALGFSEEEADKRIHLISAEDRERRSEGLWFNRNSAVDEIEHERPQATRSAKGFRSENGTLIPVVERSSADNVFLHQVIKHVIHRHFFYREKRDNS